MIESNREIKKPRKRGRLCQGLKHLRWRGYCVSVLTASGVERSCAEAVADALIDAELTGVSTHGVSRLAVYMQRMDAGVMSRENNIRIVRESTSTLVVDAGNSLGAAAAKFAMERCIAKAKETGCCFASVHSSQPLRHRRLLYKACCRAGYDRICLHQSQGQDRALRQR